jgi:hypothetical protein
MPALSFAYLPVYAIQNLLQTSGDVLIVMLKSEPYLAVCILNLDVVQVRYD